MGYLKFVSYIYLAAGAFFLYNAIIKIQAGETAIIEFVLCGLAVFMFFFRRWHQKKLENQRKNNQ